jgi:hypothetical protein
MQSNSRRTVGLSIADRIIPMGNASDISDTEPLHMQHISNWFKCRFFPQHLAISTAFIIRPAAIPHTPLPGTMTQPSPEVVPTGQPAT